MSDMHAGRLRTVMFLLCGSVWLIAAYYVANVIIVAGASEMNERAACMAASGGECEYGWVPVERSAKAKSTT